MRVSTAFNKMLGIAGASVASVQFAPDGVVVGLRRRRAKHRCPCGWKTWSVYDRRVRRWRHLDLGGSRCWLEAEVVRVACRRCRRVRTEQVGWARPGAWHTQDFQQIVAWLAQRTDKTTICRLLRVSWAAVARIVTEVVADHLDDARLEGLYRIGVDEVSYRTANRYLTVVADHDRHGAVVWIGDGRNAAVLEAFYDQLGPERVAQLEAVSLDMGPAYKKATDTKAPHVAQCVDPFHVVKLANEALSKVRTQAWRQHRPPPRPKLRTGRPRKGTGPPPVDPKAAWIKHTRWALLKKPEDLSQAQVAVLRTLQRQRSILFRGWQLKEGVRDLYAVDPADAPAHLDWWLAWACRSRIQPFVVLSRTIRANRQRILAAIELGLSNSKLEGLNSKIRLINHRGYGHRSAAALMAMIYLCCGGITIELPLR